DDLEPGANECWPARRWQFEGVEPRDGDAASGPELRVDQDRQVGAPETVDEPGQTGRMVEVTMAAHDHLDVGRVAAQPSQILDTTVGRHPRVEQQLADDLAPPDLHQGREPVL